MLTAFTLHQSQASMIYAYGVTISLIPCKVFYTRLSVLAATKRRKTSGTKKVPLQARFLHATGIESYINTALAYNTRIVNPSRAFNDTSPLDKPPQFLLDWRPFWGAALIAPGRQTASPL
jgi:hypothetical protein